MPALFDANAMIGKFPTGELAYHSVAGLRDALDRHGIARALVYHSLAWHHDPATGNHLLLEELGGDPCFVPCWVILPPATGEIGSPAEFIAALDQHGVGAVRAFPRDHVYPLAGPDCAPLLAPLAARRVPLLVDYEQSSWAEIEAVAAQYPDLPVLVCRVGYRSLRVLAGLLDRRPNVLLDLAYFGTHQGLEWLVARFGTGRVCFATGMPFTDAGGAITRLMYADLDETAVQAIGAGNLERLLAGGGVA
jgi:hypothetical protein